MAFFVATAIVGAVLGFGLAAYDDYKTDGIWFNGNAGNYISYSLGGALIGSLFGLASSSLLAGNFLANCSQVYLGAKGAMWAYSLGGITELGLYIANNFLLSIHQYSNLLGYYPSNNGFSGQAQSISLSNGTIIQRIGGTGGTYVAPYFTDPMSLSLPYNQLPIMNQIDLYIVNQELTVQAGTVAPWFGQYGGGTQYILPYTIQSLLDSGVISIYR